MGYIGFITNLLTIYYLPGTSKQFSWVFPPDRLPVIPPDGMVFRVQINTSSLSVFGSLGAIEPIPSEKTTFINRFVFLK